MKAIAVDRPYARSDFRRCNLRNPADADQHRTAEQLRADLPAAVPGVVIACTLWWADFDWMAIYAGRVFRQAQGDQRARLARDGFSYLHLPMVAGIILVSLGIKQTLAHVDEPLGTVPTFALLGGISVYLLAHVAFRLRLHSGLGLGPLTAGWLRWR